MITCGFASLAVSCKRHLSLSLPLFLFVYFIMAEGAGKPRVLITGGNQTFTKAHPLFLPIGVGFIGRNFVQFLVDNELTSKIRVIDKVPPSTGWLNARHKVSTVRCE